MPRPPQPPTDRSPWVSTALGVLGFVCAGVLLWWVFDPGAEAPRAVPEGMVEDEDGKLVDARAVFEADRAERRRAALPKTAASMMLSTFEGAGPGLAPVTDLESARDSFELMVGELEVLAERPRAIRQGKWRATYRAANDAFTALSIQLDSTNRAQAKELEEAHKRLVAALAIVRVRGGKFRVR